MVTLFFVPKISLLLHSVHDSVHTFRKKLNYSEPKIVVPFLESYRKLVACGYHKKPSLCGSIDATSCKLAGAVD